MKIAKELLENLYVTENLTTRQIEARTGISSSTLARYLHKYNIQPKPQGGKPHMVLRDGDWLRRKYIEEGKSTTQIASEIGASPKVVNDWLSRHDIQTRNAGSTKGHNRNTPEARAKMSVAKKGRYIGPDNWNWKGGDNKPSAERRSYQAKVWRNAVRDRDGWKCRHCGATGRLHAHHIKPWKTHPELRFDLDNGLTLCVPCHEQVHKRTFPAWVRGQDEIPKSAKPLAIG